MGSGGSTTVPCLTRNGHERVGKKWVGGHLFLSGILLGPENTVYVEILLTHRRHSVCLSFFFSWFVSIPYCGISWVVEESFWFFGGFGGSGGARGGGGGAVGYLNGEGGV